MDGYSGTFYLHDGNQSVAEVALDQNFQPTLYAYNGFGASGLEWRSGSGTSYSAYTYDPQGSVVQPVTLYQTGGATPVIRVRASSAYDGFGLGYTATADGSLSGDVYDAVAFGGQAGYYRDEWTGLYFLTHRYYEAGSGRFVNRDPVGYKGGINLYGFCGNNPVNRRDPSGFSEIDDAFRDLDAKGQALQDSLRAGGQRVVNALAQFGEDQGDSTSPDIRPDPLADPNTTSPADFDYGDSPTRPANMPGPKPKGTGPHNAKIAERIGQLKKSHPNWRHEAGGDRTEETIRTPGGFKSSRRPDITFRRPNGTRYRENVGKTLRDGSPVTREKKALDDLERATGTRPSYTPYDR